MSETYPSYVITPTNCSVKRLKNTDVRCRTLLKAKLNNSFSKKILFILMNPSTANKSISDKTINKCAHVAYHDLTSYKIGEFRVVNVYPYYESCSVKLYETLKKVKSISSSYYYRKVLENLSLIHDQIAEVDYIFLCTGGIPDNIEDVEEYQFILNTIHSYVESIQGFAFLGKADKYKSYLKSKKYSYHLCPNGIPSVINSAKLFRLSKGKFLHNSNQDPIPLT